MAKLCGAEIHAVFVEEMLQYAGTIGEVIEEKSRQMAFAEK